MAALCSAKLAHVKIGPAYTIALGSRPLLHWRPLLLRAAGGASRAMSGACLGSNGTSATPLVSCATRHHKGPAIAGPIPPSRPTRSPLALTTRLQHDLHLRTASCSPHAQLCAASDTTQYTWDANLTLRAPHPCATRQRAAQHWHNTDRKRFRRLCNGKSQNGHPTRYAHSTAASAMGKGRPPRRGRGRGTRRHHQRTTTPATHLRRTCRCGTIHTRSHGYTDFPRSCNRVFMCLPCRRRAC